MDVKDEFVKFEKHLNKPLTWLITGGCGFIGTNLICFLSKNFKQNIRVLDNLSVGSQDALRRVCKFVEVPYKDVLNPSTNEAVQLIVGDILDEKLLYKITKDVDIIIHLAANTGVGPSIEDPKYDMLSNTVGTFNCLESARINNVKRFVFASSGATVGECKPPIHEKIIARPVSPYGASKLAGEAYCSAYYRSFDIDTVALRFGNVYGPGSSNKSSVIAKFIKNALQKEPLKIYGDGLQTRDFIYIDDLTKAIILAALSENIGGEIFQIASNKETSISLMLNTLLPILKKFAMVDVKVEYNEKRKGDVLRNYFNTDKARDLLGWEHKTNLNDGLLSTVNYFIEKNFMDVMSV